MKKLSTVAIIAVLLGASSAVLAKSHICTTEASHTKFIKSDTVFVCTELSENMTIKDINKKGYRVVSISANNYENDGYSYTDWAIVIEK